MNRQWNIVRLLYRGPRKISELAKVFDVSTKTIRRDIGCMRTVLPILVSYPTVRPKTLAGYARFQNQTVVRLSRRELSRWLRDPK